jgi:carbonic anhydrase/acetyltransferase-like protein (isoleucine patch superfamily)
VIIHKFGGVSLGDPVFIAETAVVLGRVTCGDYVSIWYNTVLRADLEPITIGDRSNIQDNSVIHVDPGLPAVIGRNVTVGHGAIIHACTIGDSSLIGMGATVLSGARIGSHCIIGAGCVVPEGMKVPDGSLVLGVPGKIRREVTEAERVRIQKNADVYVTAMQEYLTVEPE